MRYGKAMTAYQAGWDTIWTVRFWCSSVSDWSEANSDANSKALVCASRMGRGKDSITSCLRLSTGKNASSPSLSRVVAPTALYTSVWHPSGIVMRQR